VRPALTDRCCLRLLLSDEQGDCGTGTVCCTAPGCTEVGENILFDCMLVPTGIITFGRHCVLGSEDYVRTIILSTASDNQNDEGVGQTLLDCRAVPSAFSLLSSAYLARTRDCWKVLAPWSTMDQTVICLRGDSVAMCLCELSRQVPAQPLLLGQACPDSGLNSATLGADL